MTKLDQSPRCPNCLRPLSEHWTLPLSDEEFKTWSESETVCEMTRGEVQVLLGTQSE